MTGSAWIADQFLKEATSDMRVEACPYPSGRWIQLNLKSNGLAVDFIDFMLFGVESDAIQFRHTTKGETHTYRFSFADPNVVHNLRRCIKEYWGIS